MLCCMMCAVWRRVLCMAVQPRAEAQLQQAATMASEASFDPGLNDPPRMRIIHNPYNNNVSAAWQHKAGSSGATGRSPGGAAVPGRALALLPAGRTGAGRWGALVRALRGQVQW